MSTSQLAGPFGEWRAASTATGNAITAGVTAAAAFVAFPPGTGFVSMEGRNYSTAVVIRWLLNPRLTVIKTTDNLATAANATNYSDVAQDNDVATDITLSSFSAATTSAIWVGADLPFRGVFADVDSTNSNAATMAATYWSATGPTMAALSITDGTAVTGATLQQDGGITWTVPADWTPTTLRTAGGAAVGIPESGQPKYWVRFSVNAALDSSTTLNSLLAMNRSTSYASLVTGRVAEFLIHQNAGCIEAVTDAGTANLIVNCATLTGGKFV